MRWCYLTGIVAHPALDARLTIANSGNIAIGTQAPSEKLDVDGTARLRGLQAGTDTDAIVVADADGVLKTIGATDFGGGAWDNPDGTAASQNSTDINYSAGNVGIGDANPDAKLTIASDAEAIDRLAIYSDATNRFKIQTLLDGNNIADYPYGGGNNRLALQPLDGFVGIGDSNPQAKLQVDGKTIIQSDVVTGVYDVDPSVYGNYALNAYATVYGNNQNGSIAVSAMDGDGIARHSVSLDLRSTSTGTFRSAISHVFRDDANAPVTNNEIMSFTPSGSVGIGITEPQEKLDVLGNLQALGLKIPYTGVEPTDFRLQRNDGTGNMHMYWNSTGTGSPTAIGEGTAFRLTTNTSGYRCTNFIGCC